MARAAVLMAVLCIGFAAHSLAGAVVQGWQVIAHSGLLSAPPEAVHVVRVVRQLDRAIPVRPQRTAL